MRPDLIVVEDKLQMLKSVSIAGSRFDVLEVSRKCDGEKRYREDVARILQESKIGRMRPWNARYEYCCGESRHGWG